MNIHSRYLRLPALLALAIPGLAHGGVCSPDSGAPAFDFSFKATFNSPEENSHLKVMPNAYEWNLGRNYPGSCSCSKPGGTIPAEFHFTTKTDLAKGYTAAVNGEQRQFFQVNRNIQVASEVWIDGERLQFVPMPLDSLSNLKTGTFGCGSDGRVDVHFTTGSKGRLHLLIDKPFIGESVIPRTKLFDLMAIMEGTSATGAPPMVNVWMSGSVVVPQSCQLAPGQAMTIDFGNLTPWELPAPGESPQHTVSRTFKVQCKNISDTVAINLTLEGNHHLEQRNALAVNDRNDLAIILKNDGRIVPPLAENAAPSPSHLIPLTFSQADQSGEFNLEAYPIKTKEHVEPGQFTSQATVKFEFE
ncbi:fimbrial protein [Metapseudomonas boanensis]|uniref:Fimbrial protein n=1 Tax=Metapseudomonas boanensis TaxID=2822138 RepID=A0ABS5XJ92_9GAMM|nr:fimbrial protein [Pseudomonas boanensis]MBT8767715.1 fimbrial protein [Pseudomonas boanensis]